MALTGSSWNILRTRFLCEGVPDDVAADLTALLEPFAEAAPSNRVIRFAVVPSSEPEISFGDLGGERVRLDDLTGEEVAYALIVRAVEVANEYVILHAAAVVTPQGTCLITGGSGSGKTTLALALWSRGMHLVSDDLSPFPRGSTAPEVFPRALHLDGRDSLGLADQIPPRPAAYPRSSYPFPAPRPTVVPPVTTILELRRKGRPESDLTPLTRSESVHALLRATMRTGDFSFARTMPDLSDIVGSCRCYRVSASTAQDAASCAFGVLGV